MNDYPTLHDHDDDYDFRRDVITASELSRNLLIDIRDLLQKMQTNIEFNISQVIAVLEESDLKTKADQINELQQQLIELKKFSEETIKRHNDRISLATVDLAAIPDIHGIDHICKVDIAVARDFTNRLITIYKKFAQL